MCNALQACLKQSSQSDTEAHGRLPNDDDVRAKKCCPCITKKQNGYPRSPPAAKPSTSWKGSASGLLLKICMSQKAFHTFEPVTIQTKALNTQRVPILPILHPTSFVHPPSYVFFSVEVSDTFVIARERLFKPMPSQGKGSARPHMVLQDGKCLRA